MSDIETWFITAAGNDALVPPDGAPENGTNHSDLNNIIREIQASVRREFNKQGWFEYGDGSGPYAAVFLSGSSFQIQGADVTLAYTPNTRVRITQAAGVLVGIVSASVFQTGDTDITVVLEAGSIANASITSVEIGAVAIPNPTPIAIEIRDTDRDTSVSVESSPDDDAIVDIADGQLVRRTTTKGTQLPLQPGFSVFLSAGAVDATGAGARFLIPFPDTNFQRGTMWDNDSTMTAVLDGVYDVSVMLSLQSVDSTSDEIAMEIEHSDGRFYRWERDLADLSVNIANYPITQTRKINMLAGQTLKFFIQVSGMAGNTVDLIGSTDRNRCEVGVWFLG